MTLSGCLCRQKLRGGEGDLFQRLQILAAIEGVPGREGAAVLGVRDTAGGIRVRRIERESVTLAGHDTVWNLRIRGRE